MFYPPNFTPRLQPSSSQAPTAVPPLLNILVRSFRFGEHSRFAANRPRTQSDVFCKCAKAANSSSYRGVGRRVQVHGA